MSLAVVRSIDAPRRLATIEEREVFEQELIDQYALAMVGAGITDEHVAADRSILFAFIEFLRRPVWTATPADADGFFAQQRRERKLAHGTLKRKSQAIASFYEFLIHRYQGDIVALTGVVVDQPIDEFNRPASRAGGVGRVPPATSDVEHLYGSWAEALPDARKYLPAARDYVAASLWRRLGLRIAETAMLDIGDWRPDLGELGKLHVRFGKGSRGRGPKTRLIPCIDASDELLTWWMVDVRHQFGDDWDDPSAPLFPSERIDSATGRHRRVGTESLRSGFAKSVDQWLPASSGSLVPHAMRHYCASTLYGRGVDLKAIQDLLGHQWLSTTTGYIHVHAEHIEQAWRHANDRITKRLNLNQE